MNNPPHVSVWMDILDDCRMTVALTFYDELRFTLGNSPDDDATIVFNQSPWNGSCGSPAVP